MPKIRLDHAAKLYRESRKGTPATLAADLTIAQGEFVFVAGPDANGRHTLMALLAGELEPDGGKVWLGGADLWAYSRREIDEFRTCMGVVLDGDELILSETLFKNLASGGCLEYLKNKFIHRREIEKALSLVGLSGREEDRAEDLTPSERCRGLLARAIWRSPSILVLDALAERADDGTVWDLLHLLEALNRRGTTVVFSTADNSYASTMNKRVLNVDSGRVTGGMQRYRGVGL